MNSNQYDDTARYFESDDGLRLFYRDWAPQQTGCPVLCLPGLTRNSRDFDELAQRLSARHRVLTPDLRGRGHSDRDPDWRNYHPAVYVRDTWTLLDRLGIDRVAVIGTSLGGIIAMLLAVQNASRLAGVVLNDVGPDVAPEGLSRISTYVGRTPPVSSWEEHPGTRSARRALGRALGRYPAPDAGKESRSRERHRAQPRTRAPARRAGVRRGH